ncbi:hypothetical protein ADT25_10980 [Xanthomonas oryzae]|uniref:Uncharacterized protein n=1 Tax=Xanthomonas oryzae TaxID=347 RepID=A0AAP1EYL6_9XANT|nr:hypothetical protein ADT25_10980 [Xanthomonas oryzae]QBG86445.1 hypothetical protein EYR27_21300 [Xanthomonas oryzae]
MDKRDPAIGVVADQPHVPRDAAAGGGHCQHLAHTQVAKRNGRTLKARGCAEGALQMLFEQPVVRVRGVAAIVVGELVGQQQQANAIDPHMPIAALVHPWHAEQAAGHCDGLGRRPHVLVFT